MTPQNPDISVIVPILNEAAELPALLDCLAGQRGITFEVILCDGGSVDGSEELIRRHTKHLHFAVTFLNTPRGRGCQMNIGAANANSGLLVFLHADSRFCQSEALRNSVSAFRIRHDSPDRIIAAHFALRFRRQSDIPSLAYSFYEAKARLNRSDCVRGDQGFMILRSTFDQAGRFDTSLPYLEDVRLATTIAREGTWLLLPVEITTSARRFEKEGLYERQIVNAIITNAASVGWEEFFTSLTGLYNCASESGKIELNSFLNGIRILLASKPDHWRHAFWRSTGRYVAENAWQLSFWLDVRRTFRSGGEAGDVKPKCLVFYEKHLKPIFDSRPAAWLAEWLTRSWFRLMLVRGTSRTV
jgi:rSAM/selenodomain-associated transferase 2